MITVLYFWRIPTKTLPFAMLKMALDRYSLKKLDGVAFFKSLGCGRGTKFTPRDADIHRWGLLICLPESMVESLDSSAVISAWRQRSQEEFRLLLDPISSHGLWSGKAPFELRNDSQESSSEVVAITRARISLSHLFRFWRSIPPVAASLHDSKGVIHAIGIGEAPIGLQGTFSLWESADFLRDFAYKGKAHRQAISDTEKFHWYSEELFARFIVREKRGKF